MGVVRRDSLRRWSLVSGGVAVLCLLPAAVAAWPVASAAGVDPAELRERIVDSHQPYEGDVVTEGGVGLPRLPALAEVSELLGGSARLRSWYAGPDAWRVAELTAVGERDTYRTPDGLFRWDFERNLLAFVGGEPTVWLPGAPDLVPPELARRLLATEGEVESLPSRRIAGIEAAGVRLVPADPDTTLGRVDVWADPDTGLPVRLEVAGRDAAEPVFTTRFLQVRQSAPAADVLSPHMPVGAGFSQTTTTEISDALAEVLTGELPATLAGRERTGPAALADVTGGGVYGTGLSTMVVLALPGRLGGQTADAARDAGGTPVPMGGAEVYELHAPLLTAVVAHVDHARVAEREGVHAWLLAGFLDPQLLRQAASELVGRL
jgi:hypothetical protein